MYVRREADEKTSREYGGKFRRFFPWSGVSDPDWGGAVLNIAPGDCSIPHHHDEEEMFLFLSGEGTINVDGTEESVGKGTMVYLPRFSRHFVTNTSTSADLSFVCIWWGAPAEDAAADGGARRQEAGAAKAPFISPFF